MRGISAHNKIVKTFRRRNKQHEKKGVDEGTRKAAEHEQEEKMQNEKRFVMEKNSNYYLYVHLAFNKGKGTKCSQLEGDQKKE
jgi:hypothetical protein